MNPVKIIDHDAIDSLHIGYIVGTTCNFKCHYCFEGFNDGKYRFPLDLELVKQNLGHLIDTYKTYHNKKYVRIHITGGEPTLWPDLGEFAKYFHDEHNCKISLSTNGTRTLRWWKQYAEYFDDIGISIHNERVDPYHTIEVMDWIYNNTDVLVNGTVLMDPDNWDRCVEIVDILKSHPTPWLLKARPVLSEGELRSFDDSQKAFVKDKIKKMPPKEWLQKQKDLGTIPKGAPNVETVLEDGTTIKYDTFQTIENNWQHFTGWKCNLGIDRVAIGMNGDIQGACGASTLFGLDSPLNIYDTELTTKFTADLIRPTICTQKYCICATDIRLTKEKV
jgi:molybdenum cofactor biosynthesis enzyme MoaA